MLSLALLLSLAVLLPVRAATTHPITSALQNLIRRALRASRLSALLVVMASAAHGVTMDWVTIGAPGNLGYVTNTPCLPSEGSLRTCGAVDYVYQISKYEVTNAQYVEFLNAVAASDTFGLFNPDMESDDTFEGITRLGIDVSYTYAAKGGFSQLPVTYVSFYDSLRFVNWLENGQPICGRSLDVSPETIRHRSTGNVLPGRKGFTSSSWTCLGLEQYTRVGVAPDESPREGLR